ncbi:ABC transporter transmembrane domain-containing protein [bacterium]|nr:ABC transporter transmembrane domain-containing protein [bacterium]
MAGRRIQADLDDTPKTKLTRESYREAIKAFQFIKPYKWSFIGGMVLLAMSALIFMVFPYLMGLLLDTAQGNSKFNYTLQEIGLALFVILILQGTISYFRVILFAQVSEKGTADIRRSLYQKLISFPITFFEENKTGELISRVTGDVDKLYNVFSITLAEFFRQIITLIVGIAALAVITPKLSLIMLLTIPIVVVGGIFFGRYIRKFSKTRQKELAESNSMLGESMQAIQVVKAFVNEFFEMRRYNNSISNVVTMGLSYARARALFAVFIIVVMFGALFFIIWKGAVMVQNGNMTGGELLTFFSYTLVIAGSIASLGNFVTELLGALGATERVREILNTESELNLDEGDTVSDLQLAGDVSFQNVHFHYPTRPDIPVLKGIDIDIKAGQKVALVGQSGAGKSTIIQLLLQFYPIIEGKITVDGKDIYDQNIRDFRNNLALVPQDVILFGGTIRENILYGKEHATEEEVIRAAEQSNSWEFIQSFPEGLETLVGERGVKLSGGQRQRIAIARAILKNPAILLLDEATSSLDSESEKVVQDALNNLMKGRTSIIIAHRLSTIRDVDRIYVLENGVIAEQGTHDQLISVPDGLYSSQARLGVLQ